MDTDFIAKARRQVAAVRAAAASHRSSWEALVPDSFTVDLTMEPAEEAAYADLAQAKAALRAHICRTYGLTPREFASLATP